jgi:hypothetical protein
MEGLNRVSQQMTLRAGVLVAALVALVWAGVSRGWFDGVTLALAISALGLSLLQRLPARPQLIVGPRTGDQLVLRHGEPVRPFDQDAIVAEQVEACEGEMPRLPKPAFPPGSPLVDHLAGVDAGERLDEAISGVSDQRLRAYMAEVTDYSIEVRKWLTALETGRADRLRVAEGQLRIRELGRAPADHVRLRMQFPEGFSVDEELPEVPRPPQRPRLKQSAFGRAPGGLVLQETYLQPNVRIRLPGTDMPDYRADDGQVVVTWDLGHVNQSERREVPAFSIKAPEPGIYPVDWEITADGLPRAVNGVISVVVEPAEVIEPILTLADVEDERKARELAFHS